MAVYQSTATENGSETMNGSLVVNKDFLDQHSVLWVKVVMVSVTIVISLFSITVLVALRRARHIPKTACLLSSSLLCFDCATILTFTLRNVVTNSRLLNIITLVGISWTIGSYINVAVMALDRVIFFQWPYIYIRRFNNGSYVFIYYIVMFVYLSAFTVHWVSCVITKTTFWDVRDCMVLLITIYMTVSQTFSVVICIPSLIWIVVIIIKQQQKERSRSENAPTIVVFMCCINYALCTVEVFALVYGLPNITIVARRTATEIVHMVNRLFDTCMYVLWFRECRYEFLKIIGSVIPPLRHVRQPMRNELSYIGSSNPGSSNPGSSTKSS